MVVVKSPNGYRTWYESIAASMIPVDVPGSTSANLRSLPYRQLRAGPCFHWTTTHPSFPLEEPA